jgi:hypothetical protein
VAALAIAGAGCGGGEVTDNNDVAGNEAAVPAPEPTATTGQAERAATDTAAQPSELPASASPLPLIGLIGMASAAAALALRGRRR